MWNAFGVSPDVKEQKIFVVAIAVPIETEKQKISPNLPILLINKNFPLVLVPANYPWTVRKTARIMTLFVKFLTPREICQYPKGPMIPHTYDDWSVTNGTRARTVEGVKIWCSYGGVQGQRQDPTSVKRPTDSPKVKIYLDSGNTQKEKL